MLKTGVSRRHICIHAEGAYRQVPGKGVLELPSGVHTPCIVLLLRYSVRYMRSGMRVCFEKVDLYTCDPMRSRVTHCRFEEKRKDTEKCESVNRFMAYVLATM